MQSFWQEFRYGLRSLANAPGFTAIAVITLALGIGASTAIFSGLYALVLRPLPYGDASQLVMLWDSNRKTEQKHIAVMEGSYPILQKETKCFDGLAAFTADVSRDQILASRLWGTEERLSAIGVTWQFFSVLRVVPILGRTFLPGEAIARFQEGNWQYPHVAILSYAFWQEHYGASPQVIGKTLNLNEFGEHRQYVIVGVMPKDFEFPYPLSPTKPDIFLNLAIPNRFSSGNDLSVIGRLNPDVSLAQAQTEVSTIANRIRKQHSQYYQNEYVSVVPLKSELIRDARSVLWVLFAAFSFILLIGCANAGNLLLFRAVSREKEMAIRVTLGGGRLALIRQMLLEALLLGFAGGTLGFLLTCGAFRLFLAVLPTSIYVPRLDSIALDARVPALAAGFSIFAVVLISVLPSVRLTRPNLNQALKSESFRTASPQHSFFRRPGSVLLIFEVALAFVLLTGTLLMLRSMERLLSVNRQFQPEHLLSVRVVLSNAYWASLPDEASPFSLYRRFEQRVKALPGVESVALTDGLPLTAHRHSSETFKAGGGGGSIAVAFQPAEMRIVSPEYFSLMGIRLLRGRWFDDTDGPTSLPVAVINETMARAYWPNRDPLGLTVEPFLRFTGKRLAYTIVGIVREPKQFATGDNPYPSVYVDLSQVRLIGFTALVRTAGIFKGIGVAVHSAALQIVPGQTFVGQVQTGDELIHEANAKQLLTTRLLTAFASLALLLAVVGIYGLISYYTSRRTHEIGVRITFGAQRADVMRLVLKEGIGLTGLGMAAGTVVSYGFAKSLTSLLYGVSTTDFPSFAAAALLLSFVALTACYIPAQRMMKVDPVVVLRHE